MLVPLPIGLWIFALVADLATRADGSQAWRQAAYYAIGVGVLGALLAAIPGIIDLVSLRGPTQRLGLWHMALNLPAVVVFGANFLLRTQTPDHSGHLFLTLLGVGLIGVGGWLGGEMVYGHGVGVGPRAEGPPTAGR
jgi:uncharacterized membrane protein